MMKDGSVCAKLGGDEGSLDGSGVSGQLLLLLYMQAAWCCGLCSSFCRCSVCSTPTAEY